MINRRRTSSELSLEIIDILKNIQLKSKPVEIKKPAEIKKRRIRDQAYIQHISISPHPDDYEKIDGIFIHRKTNNKKL